MSTFDLKWPHDTAIVSSFFNPQQYRQPVKNLQRYLHAIQHPVLFAELSFNGEFVTNGIHLHGTQDNIMWQKERLLNIAIAQLPEKYTKVESTNNYKQS